MKNAFFLERLVERMVYRLVRFSCYGTTFLFAHVAREFEALKRNVQALTRLSLLLRVTMAVL